jgi:hypothetical protein
MDQINTISEKSIISGILSVILNLIIMMISIVVWKVLWFDQFPPSLPLKLNQKKESQNIS